MNRWHRLSSPHPWAICCALALWHHPLALTSAQAQVAPASAWVTGTGSQPKRQFPPSAQRAQMVVLNVHEVSVNGKTTRLSPGSRIRTPTNALVPSARLVGQTLVVNHTRDTMGQVHEVWILNDAEAAERRPGADGMSTSNVTSGTP